jgi:hypothetical protein
LFNSVLEVLIEEHLLHCGSNEFKPLTEFKPQWPPSPSPQKIDYFLLPSLPLSVLGWGFRLVIEHLPSKCKVLGSFLALTHKKVSLHFVL